MPSSPYTQQNSMKDIGNRLWRIHPCQIPAFPFQKNHCCQILKKSTGIFIAPHTEGNICEPPLAGRKVVDTPDWKSSDPPTRYRLTLFHTKRTVRKIYHNTVVPIDQERHAYYTDGTEAFCAPLFVEGPTTVIKFLRLFFTEANIWIMSKSQALIAFPSFVNRLDRCQYEAGVKMSFLKKRWGWSWLKNVTWLLRNYAQ